LQIARSPILVRRVLAQLLEPPCTDPYARWCGRGEAARLPPIPIFDPEPTCSQGSECVVTFSQPPRAGRVLLGPQQIVLAWLNSRSSPTPDSISSLGVLIAPSESTSRCGRPGARERRMVWRAGRSGGCGGTRQDAAGLRVSEVVALKVSRACCLEDQGVKNL